MMPPVLSAGALRGSRARPAATAVLVCLGLGGSIALRAGVGGTAAAASYPAAMVFVAALLAILAAAGWRLPGVWVRSLGIGAAGGAVLVAGPLLVHGQFALRPQAPGGSLAVWIPLVTTVAVVEECVLRGLLFALIENNGLWFTLLPLANRLHRTRQRAGTHRRSTGLEQLDKIRPEVIINYAAQCEGAVSWKNSWRFFETNSMALARLCEELMKPERKWLERFIQIGTSEMYGSVSHAAKEDEPIKPSSPYAASKVAFDMHLMSIHKFLKFPMNIIRPSNAYCPGQLLHRVVPKTILCGLTGQKLPLQGGGQAEKVGPLHGDRDSRARWLDWLCCGRRDAKQEGLTGSCVARHQMEDITAWHAGVDHHPRIGPKRNVKTAQEGHEPGYSHEVCAGCLKLRQRHTRVDACH